jgi:hypothetical protein
VTPPAQESPLAPLVTVEHLQTRRRRRAWWELEGRRCGSGSHSQAEKNESAAEKKGFLF